MGLNTWCREGDGTSFQCSCLENPMDRGAWWAAVHEVAKSQTQLSYFTFTFHFHALEKEMATHSSVVAWRIPGMGKPGGLPSMVLHRVGQDWGDLAAAAAATHVCLIAQVQVFAIDWLWAGLGCTFLLTILVWGRVHCTSQWPVRNQVA